MNGMVWSVDRTTDVELGCDVCGDKIRVGEKVVFGQSFYQYCLPCAIEGVE